jgi:hypothetical protein
MPKREELVNKFEDYDDETIREEILKNKIWENSKIYLMLDTLEKRERFRDLIGKETFLEMCFRNNDVNVQSLRDCAESLKRTADSLERTADSLERTNEKLKQTADSLEPKYEKLRQTIKKLSRDADNL